MTINNLMLNLGLVRKALRKDLNQSSCTSKKLNTAFHKIIYLFLFYFDGILIGSAVQPLRFSFYKTFLQFIMHLVAFCDIWCSIFL